METVWYTLSAKNTADFLESDDNLGINHVQVDQAAETIRLQRTAGAKRNHHLGDVF